MARPRSQHPTAAELEVLKVLWDEPRLTVREVMERLERGGGAPRAYTSVMSLLNVMTEKSLLKRVPVGRAFAYSAASRQRRVLGGLVGDLLSRGFEGRSSVLVEHLMSEAKPTADELDAIAELIEEHRARRKRR